MQVLLSQLFLFIGLWLSGFTLADCNLVHIEEPIMTRADNVTTTTLGLFSYKDPETNGCYYWSNDELVVGGSVDIKDGEVLITGIYSEAIWNGNQQAQYYLQEVLGEDWYKVMGLCCAAWALSVLSFLYGTSYYCSTQVKAARCFVGCLVGICLPILQGLGTMFIYTSDWCDVEGCSIGRTTYYSIGASVAFLLAGINFWSMEKWPGQSVLDDLDESRGWETEKPNPKKDKYNRKDQNKKKTRKYSGESWVMEVEKSTENSHGDEEDVVPTSIPYSSSNTRGQRSDRYADEPNSPMVMSTKTRRKARPKKKTVYNGHGDPSGIIGDGTNSTMADYESSTHIEKQKPTYND